MKTRKRQVVNMEKKLTVTRRPLSIYFIIGRSLPEKIGNVDKYPHHRLISGEVDLADTTAMDSTPFPIVSAYQGHKIAKCSQIRSLET